MTDAAMTPPTTPDGALARLGELTADPTWSSKLLANDATTRGEFDSLSKIATGNGEAIAAATTAVNDERHLAEFTRGVRESFPVNNDVLQQIAEGKPVGQADKDLGEQWMKQFQSDKERVRKMLDGDSEIRRQFFHASVLIASDVKDGAAPSFSMSDLLRIGKDQSRDLRKDL